MMLSAPIHRYPDGQPYRQPRQPGGRIDPVVDHVRRQLAVVNLDGERPTSKRFLRVIHRELKIRKYQPPTIKSYGSVITSLLRWFGREPHLVDREAVRDYLEYLVDVGIDASQIAVSLSAIRTVFDKLCFRDITLGLATPRRRRRKPVILSRDDVRRLLAAAPSMRDTLKRKRGQESMAVTALRVLGTIDA